MCFLIVIIIYIYDTTLPQNCKELYNENQYQFYDNLKDLYVIFVTKKV